MNTDYDVAIIGAGTAGLAAALVADALGAHVALVERDKVSGERLWRGGVPLQTLARSAKVFDLIKRSEEFGVHIEKPRLVWSAVRLRLADVRDELRRGHRETLAKSGVTLIGGDAKFLDAHTLEVGNAPGTGRLSARRFIIATGSAPVIPAIAGLAEAGFITSDGLFERPNLPKSLLFLGGGARACEMAQAFARFGTRVVLLEEGAQLVPREEPEVAAHLLRILRAEGIEVHLNAHAMRVEADGGRKSVIFSVEGEEKSVEVGEIIVAGSRKARLDGLKLEKADVRASETGIEVEEHLRTSAQHIWACGSCTGALPHTHSAAYAARTAGANAVLSAARQVNWKILNAVTFTDPEIAHIGLSPEEARREWGSIETHRADFKALDRAVIDGEASGFALFFTTNEGRIVGAQIIGAGAGELAPVVVAAVRDGTPLQDWADTLFVSSTMSEIFGRAGNAAVKLKT